MYVCDWILLLLCLGLLLVTSHSSNFPQVNYVRPTSAVTCPAEPCLTLDQIRADPDTYITSNTVFKLLPGQHKISGNFTVANVECIMIEGDTSRSLNPSVQITPSGPFNYTFQLSSTTHVFITGVEIEGIDVSLVGTENVTLHKVVIDGTSAKTALTLTKTLHTNMHHCQVKNTDCNGVALVNTFHTVIHKTSWNNIRCHGIQLVEAHYTILHECEVNDTGLYGISCWNSNLTVFSRLSVNNTGWAGIDVLDVKETTVIDTTVNNTGWDGADFSFAKGTTIVNSIFANARQNGLDLDSCRHAYLRNVTVINSYKYGIFFCDVQLISSHQIAVKGTGSGCLYRCSRQDALLELQQCSP